MAVLLLTVEDRFQLTGRGLVLAPEVPRDLTRLLEPWKDTSVVLRLPDGSHREASAQFHIELFFPQGGKWMCYPQRLSKSDVPIGTEVWLPDTDGDPAQAAPEAASPTSSPSPI